MNLLKNIFWLLEVANISVMLYSIQGLHRLIEIENKRESWRLPDECERISMAGRLIISDSGGERR